MRKFFNPQQMLGLSLAAIGLIAAGSALAADRDIAEIHVQANGAAQRVEVDMNTLAEGQSRQLSADTGLPAIVTRTATGLTLEIAGESHDIKMPPVEVIHLGGSIDGANRQVVMKRVEGALAAGDGERRTVRVVRREGSGPLDHAELEVLVAEALADAEVAREAAALARGEAVQAGQDARKVRVIRRIERDRSGATGG